MKELSEINRKYQIIYADPPWSYSGGLPQRAKEQHYPVMETIDICSLPIQGIADNNCILFLWGTYAKLPDAFDVIKSWGFEYKTCVFIWIKTNRCFQPNQMSFLPTDSFSTFIGMGGWTRSNSELCLLGIRGHIQRKVKNISQIVYEPIKEHSKKPDIVRDKIIKLVGDLPRIELFARQKVDGWDCWGNEV